MSVPRAVVFEVSAERDQWERYAEEAYRLGYGCGHDDGYDAGWTAAEDQGEREHQALAARVLEIADPRGPEARESVGRRLRAAEAGCRRDAAEHWRARWRELYRLSRDERFLREARMTPWREQSYEQQMALMLHAARRAAA